MDKSSKKKKLQKRKEIVVEYEEIYRDSEDEVFRGEEDPLLSDVLVSNGRKKMGTKWWQIMVIFIESMLRRYCMSYAPPERESMALELLTTVTKKLKVEKKEETDEEPEELYEEEWYQENVIIRETFPQEEVDRLEDREKFRLFKEVVKNLNLRRLHQKGKVGMYMKVMTAITRNKMILKHKADQQEWVLLHEILKSVPHDINDIHVVIGLTDASTQAGLGRNIIAGVLFDVVKLIKGRNGKETGLEHIEYFSKPGRIGTIAAGERDAIIHLLQLLILMDESGTYPGKRKILKLGSDSQVNICNFKKGKDPLDIQRQELQKNLYGGTMGFFITEMEYQQVKKEMKKKSDVEQLFDILREKGWQIEFQHIGREHNIIADFLTHQYRMDFIQDGRLEISSWILTNYPYLNREEFKELEYL